MNADDDAEKSSKTHEPPKPIKKCADLQRLKLEKLMKNFVSTDLKNNFITFFFKLWFMK